MELEQLRQFDAIARQGTMSAAARTLHLSQCSTGLHDYKILENHSYDRWNKFPIEYQTTAENISNAL